MRLSLDALLVFDAIERKGSFAAAAEELHRVPSAISYTVQKLEEDLAVKLFDRSGHRAVLTPAGRELLEEGRHLLRAADELEARVKRVATGWEAQLAIAVSDVIAMQRLYPLLSEFYAIECGTRLKVLAEVFGGTWDALVTGRADLALGAPGDPPAGSGCSAHPLGVVDFVFALAPGHPLAAAPEPLKSTDILRYRAVVAADSSRELAPRTSGLLTGQDTLTVPDSLSKLAVQVQGLGVGFLPRCLAQEAIAAGKLIVKEVEEPKPPTQVFLAWRTRHKGRALQWLVEKLKVQTHLLDSSLELQARAQKRKRFNRSSR